MGIRIARGKTIGVALHVWAPLVLWATSAVAQPAWVAPPEPVVRPQLPSRVELDVDNNRVDDRIDHGIGSLRRELAREKGIARRQELASELAAPIAVEVVFTQQVTQKQIDDFAAFGGSIGHLYQSVSYGWSGTIPGASVDALATAMGPTLLVIGQVMDAQLHMDEATRTGRIRPVWAAGYAGSANGFSGTSDITVGVIDSGVDDSHTDLAGRTEYWKDYTGDAEATPRDIIQHGSHVAGIALGTGAAFGSASGTLKYTDSGNLTGVPANSFFLSGIHVPAVQMTYNLSAAWLGGGSTLMRVAARSNGVSGGFISICNTATAGSPLSLNCVSNGNATQMYSSALPQSSTTSITRYATTVSVSPYPAVGDGFNAFRGVAPGARWAGAKVFTNLGSGNTATIGAAMDDMVTQRSAHNIKVVNMSLGTIGAPGIDVTLRGKANTMVNNGIVLVCSAGNDGPGSASANYVDDPGRASLALTVGATNDNNALTRYTSAGFPSPGADEDNKPDLLAPGGSDYYSQILSVDSNDADASNTDFADRVANDYLNIKGTSMASPFVAGSAALVIDAMQKAGATWTFSSSVQPLFVKMLLCASSTETNLPREVTSGSNPTLGRATTPKDVFEGYGMMNPDAAVEAISQTYPGGTLGGTSAGGVFDRRAWGRKLGITSGPAVTLTLTVPNTADYDLYLYSASPDAKGNPVIRASSSNAGLDADESITFTPTSTETRYLFIKRVSGSGDWSLTSGTAQDSCGDGNKTGGEQCDDGNQVGGDCCSANCAWETNGAPCNDGKFCTTTDTCASGVCTGTGNPCSTGGECNNSCNESADNCASTGGTTCSSDSNPCTVDQCNGSGSCAHTAGNGGAVCRAANGVCDVQETCPGTTTACPADTFAASTTTCRNANGVCDVAEKCLGTSGACPSDSFASPTAPCRASAGVCDVAESCTGTSGACPANSLAGTSTICRATTGVCDPQEVCNGASAACPANAFTSSATVCRSGSGICDSAENCTGNSGACPSDSFAASTTVCRGSAGVCDSQETCTGTSNACPGNAFVSSTTTCRGAASVCDVDENCSGSTASCPTDTFASSTTACRVSAGVCDVQETCTGTSGTCPTNLFATTATVCRGSSDICDAQERCTGTGANCPVDAFASSSTTCRASTGICDSAENCTGVSGACPADGFFTTTRVCRAANGVCDTEERCSGAGATCPTDTFAGTTTVCRAVNGVCDVAETCLGSSGACPADGFASPTVPCRDSAGICDSAESCTGTSASCPSNNFVGSTTVCRAGTGLCDAAERCTGSTAICPGDSFSSSTTVCRASGGACDAAETCTGSSGACPADVLSSAGTVCRAASGGCDVAEECTGLLPQCPLDLFALVATTCRASTGVCDPVESCSGLSPNCPADSFASPTTACRGSAGVCDAVENCTGTSSACPANAFVSSNTVCRSASGVCDVQETCSGSAASCGVDAVASEATSCRASAGECDVAESCDGVAKNCPVNDFEPADTSCSSDGLPCTEDVCSGSSATCTHPAGNPGTVCRGSAGVCDVQETCTGSNTNCPANAFAASTLTCRASGGVCDLPESCTGASAVCPGDSVATAAVACRASAGECDVAETCDGAAKNCPPNDVEPADTACSSDGQPCTEDVCDGESAACTHPAGNAGTTCRASGGVCDTQEICNGINATCPADAFAATTTVCRASGGVCDVQETCSGAAASCPADAVATSVTTCRTSTGECDLPESCNGTAKSCVADAFVSNNTGCTSDGNSCTNDVCNGSSGTCQHPNNTASCNDGVFCNGADTCSAGACSVHAGDPCIGPDGDGNCAESCDESGDSCSGADSNGSPCNDGVFCNGADTCSGGTCSVHVGNPCPGADGDGNCAESCNEAGDSCTASDPNASPCNDGLFCTANDTCSGGVCGGSGNPCPGADGDGNCSESCSEAADACTAADPNASACNDGLFCTADDECSGGACVGSGTPCPGADGDANCAESCNEAGDNCTAADTNGSTCNDGTFCNGADTCSAGACGVHAGNPCIGPDGDANCAESCSESSDTCTAPDPNNSTCNDGLACTTQDACQAGACVPGQNNCGVCGDGSVDDGETCDDGNTANGDCCSSTCTPASNGIGCNDGQFCNGNDTCQAGACTQHSGNPCPGSDGDGDCSETCNEAADACSTNDPDASACDDGLFCNGADTCSSGACTQHAGSPCPGADGDGDCAESCKESNDTCTASDTDASACDDGLFCNGADTCSNGNCSQHGASPCAGPDGDGDCAESCNEAADNCTAADTTGSPCNDGVFCNGSDTCSAGACNTHGSAPCVGPDGDGNCAESCNEAADNCTASDENGSACNDNAFCNGADTCSNGACSQHGGSPCPGADGDGNCVESCNEAADGCNAADPDGSPCTDGELCTIDDSCEAGVCTGDESSAAGCTGTTTTTLSPTYMCGDTNDDGKITASDAQYALRSAVGTASCIDEICDYNGDGRVAAGDAQAILRRAVGQATTPNCPTSGAALVFVTSTVPVTSTTMPSVR